MNFAFPEVTTRKIPQFPLPNIDEHGIPLGGFTLTDVIVFIWVSVQDGVKWDFMYRIVDGDGIWLKPRAVVAGSGAVKRSILLPDDGHDGNTYEFLPLAGLPA